jgi:hypothetical protein
MSRSKKKDYPKKFDPRRFSHSCRNHGSCGYCERNRVFFDLKARAEANLAEQEKDFYDYMAVPDLTDVLLGLDLPPA